MPVLDCVTGSINPYIPTEAKPWNKQRVLHLCRRMGFGATPDMVNNALNSTPSELVDTLIDQAINTPLPDPPTWANWEAGNYESDSQFVDHLFEWGSRWLQDMRDYGFRDKFALFWHNHFVTQWQTYYCSKYLYQYHQLLQEHALGNFKMFTKAIGKTPAMLVYLNGNLSTKFSPNENYARELYELFTLGEGNNYTQTDIEETARALTGWVVQNNICADPIFTQDLFDNEDKTIFGQTNNWNYESLHDLLFEVRAEEIAQHICTKIYQHFVSQTVDEDIVNALAETFMNNDFEIAPVFRQLFKSEHFFDDALIGVQIKSPIDFFITFAREGGFPVDDEILTLMGLAAGQLGQALFEPIDVAGWQGHYNWLTSSTLTARWEMLQNFIYILYTQNPQVLVNFVKELTDNSNDPDFIVHQVVDHFTGKGLQTEGEYQRAVEVFKSEVPENYFEDGSWNLDWDHVDAMVALLLVHIIKLPEHQLS